MPHTETPGHNLDASDFDLCVAEVAELIEAKLTNQICKNPAEAALAAVVQFFATAVFGFSKCANKQCPYEVPEAQTQGAHGNSCSLIAMLILRRIPNEMPLIKSSVTFAEVCQTKVWQLLLTTRRLVTGSNRPIARRKLEKLLAFLHEMERQSEQARAKRGQV